MTKEWAAVAVVVLYGTVIAAFLRLWWPARNGKSHDRPWHKLPPSPHVPQARLQVKKVWDVEPENVVVLEGRPINFWTDSSGKALVSLRQDDGLVVTTPYYIPPASPGWTHGFGETIIEVRYV